MTDYAIVRNNTPMIVAGDFLDNDGTRHSSDVLGLWTDAELATINVHPVVDAPVPAGFSAISDDLDWNGEVVTRVYTTEAIDLADAKAAKLNALATRRWQAEEGGTTLGGAPLATDRTTQTKLTAAYIKASADPAYSIPAWKSAPGVFSALDAATIIAAADAIEAHVQACFAREAVLSGEIDDATDWVELSAVNLDAGWP